MKHLFLALVVLLSGVVLAACTHQDTTTDVQETTQTIVNEAESELDQINDEDIELESVNNSGQMGEATIRGTEAGQTEVVLTLQGGTFTQPQPAHIHEGDCPGVGKIAYTLNPVQNGFSNTILDIDPDELEDKQLAINIHESTANIDNYTACGELDD
ncbi:MAG TPA: hypothetical protein VF209_04200 [Patescibacteria group bacterium]